MMTKKSESKNTLVLIIAMFLAGGILMAFGVFNVKRGLESSGWPTVDGKITRSSVVKQVTRDPKTSRNRTSYKPDVRFSYKVNGKSFSANKVSFGDYSSGSQRRAEKIIKRYPSGKSVSVHYSLKDPGVAVLETHITLALFIPLLGGIIFLGIGVLITVKSLKKPVCDTDETPLPT